MELKSTKFEEKFLNLRNELKEAIFEILKKYKIESINFTPYLGEGYITNYAFFDTNKDGNGECLELCTLAVKKDDNIIFEFDTNYGDSWGDRTISDMSTEELFYILEMIEEVIDFADEDTEEILKIGEDFDDE